MVRLDVIEIAGLPKISWVHCNLSGTTDVMICLFYCQGNLKFDILNVFYVGMTDHALYYTRYRQYTRCRKRSNLMIYILILFSSESNFGMLWSGIVIMLGNTQIMYSSIFQFMNKIIPVRRLELDILLISFFNYS